MRLQLAAQPKSCLIDMIVLEFCSKFDLEDLWRYLVVSLIFEL